MTINAITSFKGEELNLLVAQKVAYTKDETPVAARPMQPDSYQKSGSSTGKKIAWTTAILLAGAATLGVLSKNGKLFNKLLEEDAVVEGFVAKSKYYIAKAGDWLSEKAYIGKAWDTVKSWLPKAEKAAENVAE